MKTLRLALASALVVAALAASAPRAEASGCPIYQSCMDSVDFGCLCDGFYCNGRFICGIPFE